MGVIVLDRDGTGWGGGFIGTLRGPHVILKRRDEVDEDTSSEGGTRYDRRRDPEPVGRDEGSLHPKRNWETYIDSRMYTFDATVFSKLHKKKGRGDEF